MKKIGIIGSRRRNNFADLNLVKIAFQKIYQRGDWIVSGGCPKGGDRFAEIIAQENGIPIIIFYADWKHKGKCAGFIRNKFIAQESDILIVCVANDRTGGTENTINYFTKIKPNNQIILC